MVLMMSWGRGTGRRSWPVVVLVQAELVVAIRRWSR